MGIQVRNLLQIVCAVVEAVEGVIVLACREKNSSLRELKVHLKTWGKISAFLPYFSSFVVVFHREGKAAIVVGVDSSLDEGQHVFRHLRRIEDL